MMVVRLDKTRPYRIVRIKGRKPYCIQDDKEFTCGGYPLVNGVPVGIPLQPAEINAARRHNLTFDAQKTAKEASADAEAMIRERDGLVYVCEVCEKEYRDKRWYDKHMKTAHNRK